MPLPGPEVIGFGYVASGWKDDDSDLLSEDSRLSSTSLVHTMIEPSSSEDEWLWVPEDMKTEDNIRYTVERDTLMKTMSFMRRTEKEKAKEAGLSVDFQEVRDRDNKRTFEKQMVPTMSEVSKEYFKRKEIDTRDSTLAIPLFESLGIQKQDATWEKPRNMSGKYIVGAVGDLLAVLEDHNRKRSAHIMRFKEKLEKEKARQVAESSNEKLVREMMEIAREEEVLGDRTSEEKETIKEILGDIPTRRESAYYPYGKKHISAADDDIVSYKPSYDDFRASQDDFNRYLVHSKEPKDRTSKSSFPKHSFRRFTK